MHTMPDGDTHGLDSTESSTGKAHNTDPFGRSAYTVASSDPTKMVSLNTVGDEYTTPDERNPHTKAPEAVVRLYTRELSHPTYRTLPSTLSAGEERTLFGSRTDHSSAPVAPFKE
jgi:hypothetical protein